MAAYEAAGETDEWYTPAYIFQALGLRFDLDVASPSDGPRHVPANKFLTSSDDGLCSEWSGLVWMNPPFGHQSTKRKWLRRFFDHGNGIALLPDRTSAPWWQEFAPLADAVLFISPKVKFEMPESALVEVLDLGRAGMTAEGISKQTRFSVKNVIRILGGEEPIEAPGTGTTLFASGPCATSALAQATELGTVFRPLERNTP